MAGRPDAVSATSRTAVTPSRANDGRSRDGATDTRGTTAVTAEIPAVPVAPAYGVLLPDGSIWYPGSKRKLPAPTYPPSDGLVAGLSRPPRRRRTASSSTTTRSGWTRSATWSRRRTAGRLGPRFPPRHDHDHSVDESGVLGEDDQDRRHGERGRLLRSGASFSFDIKATRDCDVVVTSVKNGAYLFNSVIPGGTSKLVSVASGAAVLKAFAGGASLVVTSGGKTVGTIPALAYAVAYTFSPTNS